MKKIGIKNRKTQKIVLVLEEIDKAKGLVFLMHGLSGRKEEKQIRAMAETFLENNYSVISFDTTNTYGESDGESDGNPEDATVTNYYEDLEDVINWAGKQDFYEEPFVLVGHSTGAMCVSLYAEKYPEKVKALAPISVLISGKLILEAFPKEYFDKWKKDGVKEWKGHSGKIKRLKWTHMEDRLKYDVLKEINKITVPVLLIVGEKDELTPLKHHQILYNRLSGRKELHIIKNAEHPLKEESDLKELREIFDKWIKTI